MEKLLSKPIFFKENRVYRVYLGGKGIALFNGSKMSEDDFFPEEWIASKVKAINPKYFSERDGVSVVEGTNWFFDDLLEKYPHLLLGDRKYDCLVKYLDSAIRLPMQVHPTKEFAKKHFNSEYGKTEAWLVLATRPNACIYFGFKKEISKEELSKLEKQSEEERNIMSSILHKVEARVGDVFIINAGLIHAIGAGCTILEVQEPTDFTIQPERWCGDYHISYQEEYIGLDKDTALDCFDYSLVGEKAVMQSAVKPKVVYEKDGVKKEELIGYDITPCFGENRYTVKGGKLVLNYAPSVWICTSGKGVIKGEDYQREINKGDYFFLPYVAEGKFFVESEEGIEMIECLPSKQ